MDCYISILLIALCIAISPAASRYTMEITAVSYVNPTDDDYLGLPCDIGSLCDVYFKFCVRNINTSATNDICWPSHLIQSSHYIETQNYTFPPTGLLYPQTNVSNPVTFTSNSSWTGSFQLLVVIYDDDGIGIDDLVDRNVFNLVLPADGTTSSDMAVLGVYSKATFTARIRVSCQQGFSGDDCLTTTPSTTTTTDVTIIATPSTTTTTTDVTIIVTPLTTTSSSTIIANTTSTAGTSEITSTNTMIAATPTNTTAIITSTGDSTTSTTIIATPSTTTSTTGTSASTTSTITTTSTGTSITSTITSTTSLSLPTTELSPNVQLFAGLGAGILVIRIILLVIIVMAIIIISICCYRNRRKSPPAYENLQMSNMNPETKESLAQGHGVPTSSQ